MLAPWVGGRHLARRGARLALLLWTDLACLAAFTLAVQATGRGSWVPPAFGEALEALAPLGTPPGVHLALAAIFVLTLLGAYGAVDRRQAVARRTVAAALVVTLPGWEVLWARPTWVVMDTWLLLMATLALALLA
ncbi:MAG: hypothetical protein ABIQ49_07590, partial [Gemmatimonadales bacterium]